jgi:uncharacterized integral membrane protein (TIGR00698 family)
VSKIVFILGLLAAASGLLSPPVALAAGLVFGFTVVHPFAQQTRRASKWLLQASVVGLGFGMNFGEVLRVGRSGFLYTAVGISLALTLGWLLGKALHVAPSTSYLISAGTAICGGSAIAAISPVAQAGDEEVAVSMGTVFVLNSIALLVFPIIGHALHLSQTQFGLWSALAIHDTSSVVGAAAKYGAVALAIGTTVKLARALWIVPVSIGTAMANKSKAKIQLPWFILLFCMAAVANTYATGLHPVFHGIQHLGMLGLTVTLFLIGSGISKETVRRVGLSPMLQGIALWVVVAVTSLLLIRSGIIHL